MSELSQQLSQQRCEVCRTGAPQLSDAELNDLMPQIPEWECIAADGERQLCRVFKFSNFAKAMNFAQQVAELAEREDHHPAILVEWGRATVRWWTHKIGGLHRNDVVMAAKTDSLV